MVPLMGVRFPLLQPSNFKYSSKERVLKAKALVLAAGVGTRMKSAKPKVLHEILGKPMLRWVVDSCYGAGCEKVHVVIGHKKELVEPILPDCEISYQLEMLGTGHTVMCGADKLQDFKGTLLILCGDTPLISKETLQNLIETHESCGNAATVLTMHLDNPSGYGRIVRQENAGCGANTHGEHHGSCDNTHDGRDGDNTCGSSDDAPASHATNAQTSTSPIAQIIEDKDCTPEQLQIKECNSGIYCFDAERLFANLNKLDRNNAQGEYYLTDMIKVFNSMNLQVDSLVVSDNDECLGVNSRLQLAQASKIMQRRINAVHMLAGVSMPEPDLVWIEPGVAIENDVEILPLTWLNGTTSVKSGSTIGPNTRLTNCSVGKNCRLDEVVGIDAVIEDDCSAGPRAYLREGTHLCAGAKIGTHVELKKAHVGQGSKIPHLSYVGDAEIGTNCNLGAGTVTCNYDGINKHKTTIGNDVFIGSSTMLVAPVNIGSNVTIGALSCITKDVPNDALSLERSEQIIKLEWAKRKKNK